VLPQVELHSASTMGTSDTLSSAVVADASSWPLSRSSVSYSRANVKARRQLSCSVQVTQQLHYSTMQVSDVGVGIHSASYASSRTKMMHGAIWPIECKQT
jgi:hypothetical protein